MSTIIADPQTRNNDAFFRLQEAIVKGEIAPGSKLKEAELSATYGISRGPLREALNRLEGRKLVRKIPHVGAQVVDLDLKELAEIYLIRESLEALACRLAARQMSDQALTDLGELLTQHAEYIDAQEGKRYFNQQGDLDFHYCIIQGSGNQSLINLLCDELYQLVRRYRYTGSHRHSRPQQALAEHQRIYEALLARDGELAALLMQRHIQTARRNIERTLAEDMSDVDDTRLTPASTAKAPDQKETKL
ncbi:GntR family transcriptional regulator [Corallincola spongiicola]|uniref:GntR family transcriptional regulator n=1 Tax=Corallincola spongiicola TaxID=2520508 RepID=A0ABY1WT87_9GAMM|nr:GntR family transcriptional regulator [Corallincola spongiicola]TAA47953.1 GntR family transcriptional regulator [Corallincola spongiicola]